MGDAGVYTRTLLRRRVKLPAALQNRHAAESVAQLLRASVEGVCGPDGYVRPRSVDVVDVSPGIIEMSSLSGHAVYNVRFRADVCNPAVGHVLTCRVENANSYGVLAVNQSDTRVLEVILQRDPVSFQHAERLDGLEPGDLVTVEVMCRHFKLGQRSITLVGRAVSTDHAPRDALDSDGDDDLKDPKDPKDPKDVDSDTELLSDVDVAESVGDESAAGDAAADEDDDARSEAVDASDDEDPKDPDDGDDGGDDADDADDDDVVEVL